MRRPSAREQRSLDEQLATVPRRGEQRAASDHDERQRRRGEELPEARAGVLRIREPARAEDAIVPAEEHRHLDEYEREEEGDEDTERDRPFRERETVRCGALAPLGGPPDGQAQAEGRSQHERKRQEPSRERRRLGERELAGDGREGGIARQEERGERQHDARSPGRRRAGPDATRRMPAGSSEGASRRRATGVSRATTRGPPAATAATTPAAARSSAMTQLASSSAACAASASARTRQTAAAARARRCRQARREDERSHQRHRETGPLAGKHRGADERRCQRERSHCGSSTTILQPCGVRSSVRIVPSWSSTIQRAIDKPSPLPPSPLECAWSDR